MCTTIPHSLAHTVKFYSKEIRLAINCALSHTADYIFQYFIRIVCTGRPKGASRNCVFVALLVFFLSRQVVIIVDVIKNRWQETGRIHKLYTVGWRLLRIWIRQRFSFSPSIGKEYVLHKIVCAMSVVDLQSPYLSKQIYIAPLGYEHKYKFSSCSYGTVWHA